MAETTETPQPEPTEAELPSPTEAQAETPTEAAPASTNGATPAETTEPAPAAPEAEPFDAYVALEREEMKPVLEARDRRTRRDLETEFSGKLAEQTRNWEATQTANTLAGYVGTLLQRVADSDADGFDKSVQGLLQFATPLMNDYKQAVKGDTIREVGGIYASLLAQGLNARDRDTFEKFQESIAHKPAAEQWQASFEKREELKFAQKVAAKDAEIARLSGVIEKQKADGRTGQGPATGPGTSGGGGIDSYEEASRRYNLPIGHPQKISHDAFKEQRARFGIK